MEAICINRTRLTYDMYRQGVVNYYKSRHMVLRAVSYAYGAAMLVLAYFSFLYLELALSLLFLGIAGAVFFWNLVGYRMGTKNSFMKFAGLHQSHYCVELEYRFFKDRLEQETEKTALTVFYNKIEEVCDFVDILVIVFDKQLIVVDKMAFPKEGWTKLQQVLAENHITIKGGAKHGKEEM